MLQNQLFLQVWVKEWQTEYSLTPISRDVRFVQNKHGASAISLQHRLPH